MRTPGKKASELIKELQKLIERYGDREVISGGSDYPGGVGGVDLNTRRDDPYIPQGAFYLWSNP